MNRARSHTDRAFAWGFACVYGPVAVRYVAFSADGLRGVETITKLVKLFLG